MSSTRGSRRSVTSSHAKKPGVTPAIPTKPRLTHFLCVPLGHHAELRDKWSHISSELLVAVPPIPGLHASIIVPSRSLHLTLGVLSLVGEDEKSTELDANQDTEDPSPAQTRKHTLSDALSLLQSLHEPITNKLREVSAPLTVPLERLDVMNSDPSRAHVLWTGPDVETGAGARLLDVCELVHTAFREAGMLQDTRSLKLHCTLINTIYRRPRGKRVPFSCSQLRTSAPYGLMTAERTTSGDKRPWSVNLGSWLADEVQLCEMGRTSDGAYRSVGGIALFR